MLSLSSIGSDMLPRPVVFRKFVLLAVHRGVLSSVEFPVLSHRADLDADATGGYVAPGKLEIIGGTGFLIGQPHRVIGFIKGV